MGWNSQDIFNILIVEGAKGGVFIYDSSGNLIASAAFQANVDPLTHTNKTGIVSYSAGLFFSQLINGLAQLGSLNPATTTTRPAQLRFIDSLAANVQPKLELRSPAAGLFEADLTLLGNSADASQPVQILASGGNVTTPLTSAFFEVQGSTAIGPANGSIIEFLAATGVAATDTAALAAILSAGNTPWLLPGTFELNCGNATLTALGPGQYIICSGDLNTIINAHGSGDLFRWVHTGSISDGTTTGGGIIGGCTIDGSACTGAAIAVHAGDINALRFDFRAQHFTKTGGSWGMLCDNANNFTERLHLNVRFKDCGFAGGDGGMIGFTVTSPGGLLTSTGSFARLRARIEITQGSNQQDGLVLNNGAHIYDHELELIGNFQGDAVNPTTAAALRIIGQIPAGHPGAGTKSAISNGRLDIGIECSSATNAPTTFVQGSTSNSITDCYGNVNWNNNFTSSGITSAGWKFDGQVQGDTALGTRGYYGTAPLQTLTGNGQTIQAIVPSAKIPLASTANVTGTILSPGDKDGQVIWLLNTGANPVQFAAAGTSNVAAGAGVNLSVGRLLPLIWDAGTALWYSI